jgi:hypothetical protein
MRNQSINGPAGEFREIRLVGSLIERLLSLESAIEDLRFANRCLEELKTRITDRVGGTPTTDFEVVQIALWQAAVVAYARCYVSGRRKGVADSFRPPGHASTHRELMDIRATHLAHMDHASTRESTSITVQLREEEDRLTFKVDTRGLKEILPTSVALEEYLATVAEALGTAKGAYDATVESMRDALRQMPPGDIVNAARHGRSVALVAPPAASRTHVTFSDAD